MSWYPPEVTIPVYAVFTAVGIGLTALRFWSRMGFSKQSVGIDDWFILVGLFFVCACACIQFYNAIHGTGGSAITSKDDEQRQITSHKINLTMIVIEKPGFGAIKLSLLFFYKRIFNIWPSFRRANNILIWIISAWTISFAVADLAICKDKLYLSWGIDQTIPKEYCGDKGLLLLMFAITSVITDMMVLLLPFVYVSRLQMARQKKWAAMFIFFLGTLSTAAGVLRTIFLSIAYKMGRMDWDYKQPPGEGTPLILQVFNPTFWVMIEILLGLWAANLPPLAPLLQAMGMKSMMSTIVRKASAVYDTMSRGEKNTTQLSGSDPAPPIPRQPDDDSRPIFDPYYELDTRLSPSQSSRSVDNRYDNRDENRYENREDNRYDNRYDNRV